MALEKSPASSAAESGAVSGDSVRCDPDLAQVVAAWPDLADTVRAEILSLVKGAIDAGAKGNTPA